MTFPVSGRTTASRVRVGVATLLALVAVVALPSAADAAESLVANTVIGGATASPVSASVSARTASLPAVAAPSAADQAQAPDRAAPVTRVPSAGRAPFSVSLTRLLLLLLLVLTLVLAAVGSRRRATAEPSAPAPGAARSSAPPSCSSRPQVPRGPPGHPRTQARRRPVPRETDRPAAGPCFGGRSWPISPIAPTISPLISTWSTNAGWR